MRLNTSFTTIKLLEQNVELPMERKIAHLERIQSVVERMSTSSFKVRGWAVTITSSGQGVPPIELPEDYFTKAGDVARRRVLTAGLRLA